MDEIIYNSFPRSGNVYSGSVTPYFFKLSITTVHLPEIFSVKELHNVTVFRKPEDAIASLINKQNQNSTKIEEQKLINLSIPLCDLYRKYMNYAEKNKDLIYIGKFEDLINNTVKHFESIAKKFQKELLPNYENDFKNVKFSGKLWDDRYDGHMPRHKDEVRLDIEDKIKSFLFIQQLNKEYEEFVDIFATKIN